MILSLKVFRSVKIQNNTQFILYYNDIYQFRRMKIYGVEIRSISLEGCIIPWYIHTYSTFLLLGCSPDHSRNACQCGELIGRRLAAGLCDHTE